MHSRQINTAFMKTVPASPLNKPARIKTTAVVNKAARSKLVDFRVICKVSSKFFFCVLNSDSCRYILYPI